MASITYDVRNAPGMDEDTAAYPIFNEGRDTRHRTEDRRWPMYSADDLGDFRPVEWLIPNWLAANELTVLYGSGDTYKSFIALTWACQLAVTGQTVIYIAAEGMSGLRSRIAAWQVHNRAPSLASLLVIEQNVALHNSKSVADWQVEVIEQVNERNLPHPKLVVVDTVARNFVGGDENSARDMGAFVDGCETIRKKLGTAVLPIHHTRKDDRSERGTESLRNASFAMFKTERPKKRSAEGRAQVQLKCDRMKDAEAPNPANIEFDQVALPQLSDWNGQLISSLAMSERFPPVSTSPDERPDFLQTILDVLQAVGGEVGMDKLIDKVRQGDVSIGTDAARSLLREYANDDAIPIRHGDRGYYIEAQA